MQIVKRNGELQEFNPEKIEKVISKALSETKEQGNAKELSQIVCKVIRDGMTVEQIQDLVFDTLVKNNLVITAREFERYRTRRTVLREQKLNSEIERFLDYGDDENSNKKTDVANVKRDLIAGEYFRKRREKMLPKDLLEAHRKKAIYQHDFSEWEKLTNCSLINLQDMLMNGTHITNANINQPNSIQTAFNIASQIALSVANQEFGGIGFSNINEILSFFAKKNFRKNFIDVYRLIHNIPNSSLDETILELEDSIGRIDSGNKDLEKIYEREFTEAKNKTRKDIYDACQIFEYQVNSLSASSQTPFISLTFNIPTSWESEEIILQYLKVRQRGLGKEYGSIQTIFPKLSYIVVDGYNLKDTDPYFHITKEVAKTQMKCVYPDELFYSKEDYDNGVYYGRMG